jgi:hypothetical protein
MSGVAELTPYGQEQILSQLRLRTNDERRAEHGLSALIERNIEETVNGFMDPVTAEGTRLDTIGARYGFSRHPDGETDEQFRERLLAMFRQQYPLRTISRFENLGGIQPGEYHTIAAYTGVGRSMFGQPQHRRVEPTPIADRVVPTPSPETRRGILEWIRQSDGFQKWSNRYNDGEAPDLGPTVKEMEKDYRV